jgi:sorbitol/mannitol transport system substrate-binding protein
MVSNPQMQDAIKLSDQFEAQNPGIHLKFVTLPENEARAKITMWTATGGREFDVVMISNYETRQWAHNGWLTDLWNEFFFAVNLTAVRADDAGAPGRIHQR